MSFVSKRLLFDRFYVFEFVPYRFALPSLGLPLSYIAGSYRLVYQELWWRRIVKVVVCHLIYGMCGWIRGTRCAVFSYCKTDACKLNDDRTNNTESICKFTAGNAHYWTRDGNVSFQVFAAVVAEMLIVWVIIRCGIISFPRYFARTRCHHIQGDWIRFWWMLKWLEEAKWGRYTISPLFPLRSCDWLHSPRPSICICRQASNVRPVVLSKTSVWT